MHDESIDILGGLRTCVCSDILIHHCCVLLLVRREKKNLQTGKYSFSHTKDRRVIVSMDANFAYVWSLLGWY